MSTVLRIVYRARFPGHWFALRRPRHLFPEPRAAGLVRSHVAHLLDEPLAVVAIDELLHSQSELGKILIGATVDDLLLEGAVEALGYAVGLGLLDEGVAGVDAPELDLIGEMLGQVLGAVVHTQSQA